MPRDIVGVTVGAAGLPHAIALLHARNEVGPRSSETYQQPVTTIWTVEQLERLPPRTPHQGIVSSILDIRRRYPINDERTFRTVVIDSNAGGQTQIRKFRSALSPNLLVRAFHVSSALESEATKVSRQELLFKLRQKVENHEFEVAETLTLATELRSQMEHASSSDKWRDRDANDDLLSAAALGLWTADRNAGGWMQGLP